MIEDVQNVSLSEKRLSFTNTLKKYTYLTVKKIFDIVCSLVAVILLIPIAIFVKISYLLNGDTKSIFYTQKRIGLNGKEFNFYKFRTMVPNADKVLKELLESDENLRKEYEENKKLKNDPRITKAGLFLRKTSLDEFPQFLNAVHKKIPLTS